MARAVNSTLGLNKEEIVNSQPVLIIALSIGLLSGCASMDKRSVLGLTRAGYEGKELGSTLKEIRNNGFFCQEMPIGSNPWPAIGRFTSDGTFNDLKMYQCMKQSSYFFWMTSTYTYVMGQYGKVVGIGHMGSYKTKSYLWDQEPPTAICISKCLNASGNLE